ncbi:unnamed protein product [Camellia sinensis]
MVLMLGLGMDDFGGGGGNGVLQRVLEEEDGEIRNGSEMPILPLKQGHVCLTCLFSFNNFNQC